MKRRLDPPSQGNADDREDPKDGGTRACTWQYAKQKRQGSIGRYNASGIYIMFIYIYMWIFPVTF